MITNGKAWRTIVMPKPFNAQLNQIAVIGDRMVATGGWDTQHQVTPAFAMSSADGRATWQRVRLGLPAADTVVTALTAGQHGFVAAGRYVQQGQQHVVLWKLPIGAEHMDAGERQDSGDERGQALRTFEDAVVGLDPIDPAMNHRAAVVTPFRTLTTSMTSNLDDQHRGTETSSSTQVTER
jgi:hypothetical protein